MKSAILLTLVLMPFTLMVCGQKNNRENLSFFDRFVIDSTRLSDVKQSLKLIDDTLNLAFYEYTPTESDYRDFNYKPESITMAFYKKGNGDKVLGAIQMSFSFSLEITKDYDTDKKNKNRLLVKTQSVASSILKSLNERNTPVKKIDIVNLGGDQEQHFLCYDIWKTTDYNAVVQSIYENWLLAEKYKDMKRSWSEGGELLSVVSLKVVSHELQKILTAMNPDRKDERFDLLDMENIDDYIDNESYSRLHKILTDAANNIMEEEPVNKTLRNENTFIPDGLRPATKKELSKYSWQVYKIKNKEIAQPKFHINFAFDESGDSDVEYNLLLSGDDWFTNRSFKMISDSSVISSRMDIDILPPMVSGDDEGAIFENYLDDTGDEGFSLFFDKDNNLVFISIQFPNLQSVLKRIAKIEPPVYRSEQ